MVQLNSFKMIKLNLFRALRNFILVFGILFIFCHYAFSQSYHDCTDTEELDDFLEQDISSEEMIDMMDLEFSKSLSKFDKCIDNNYQDTKNNREKNQLDSLQTDSSSDEELAEQKEQEGKSSAEELAKQKEQEGKSSVEELAEQKEQEGKSSAEELAKQKEQEGKSSVEELAEQKEQESVSSDIGLKKESYNYNKFYTYNSEKMIESVPTSQLSGNETKKETAEEFSRTNEPISQNNSEYESFEEIQGEENNSKIPEDIPQDDNDSVLEEQIKLAAINEKDPEKKKRLWNEYRKYKGLPQK